MKKILLLLAALVISAPVFAADNAVIVTPGSGVTMRSKDIGSGVQMMMQGLGTASGTQILPNTPLTAGSATATDGFLPGCRYTSTIPALTDTQQAAAQFDVNCHLQVRAVTILRPSANFTRPNDTTTYAVGDMVANSTTPGSVTPLDFTVNTASTRQIYITRAIISKSTTGVTAPAFRLHLYTASPTIGGSSGDNAAYTTTLSGHFCDIDINMFTTAIFSDGNDGIGAPNSGTSCAVTPTTTHVFGLIEARGAYAPGAQEVFTVTLEVFEP